jgi:hypothetical protein
MARAIQGRHARVAGGAVAMIVTCMVSGNTDSDGTNGGSPVGTQI